MLVAAVIGLLGSGTAALIMRSELTGFAARGAVLDVLGDTIGSIAAIVAALLVIATGWEYADPLASLAIVILVVPRALLLLRDAMNVLMESTPRGLSLQTVRDRFWPCRAWSGCTTCTPGRSRPASRWSRHT
jgi:cobalt-zinc-cadmium efflux system protein